jgi:hypothetical protein
MWSSMLPRWVFATAIILEAGAGLALAGPAAAELPPLVTTRQPVFAIPFRLDRTSDPAWQPVEALLYVSIDQGQHWQLYARAPASKQRFMVRAVADGEYWFAIRTADRSGKARPESIAEPGLRVLVDSRSPGQKTPPKPGQDGRARTAQRTGVPQPHGAVSAAVHPAIGRQAKARSADEPRMVNSRTFELEYDVDSVGPSGIGRVELWGTRDGGRTWRSFVADDGNRGSLRVTVDEEGMYGFCIVAANGAGVGGKPPAAGQKPEMILGVDLTKPVAQILSAQQGVDVEFGKVVIAWQADDQYLADRPVTLSYSANRSGPWTQIATGLENTGRYVWLIDSRIPPRVYLRLEVRDLAGNVGVHETGETVAVDASCPTVHIRGVRPVEPTTSDAASVPKPLRPVESDPEPKPLRPVEPPAGNGPSL